MVKADSSKNITVTQGFVDKLLDKISNILQEQYLLKEVDEEQAEEIELLLDKISSIECDPEELTKSLAKGSYPLKLARSIKVSPASAKPDIVPIAIAKPQLINTYNEIPALLSSYINHVCLTPDSYRGKNSNGIVLETTIKGNYWAIATQESKEYKYWLVPNSNISFNIHKIKTLENMFQLKGNYDAPNADFILEEPAVLSLLPDNKRWKLVHPGSLFFGKNSKPASLQSNHKPKANPEPSKVEREVLSSLTAFQTELARLNKKIFQLEIQSEIVQKAYQREQQEWLSEKETLNIQFKKITDLKSQLSNLEAKIVTPLNKYELDFVEESDRTYPNHDLDLFNKVEKNLDSGTGDHNPNNSFNFKSNQQEGRLYNLTGDRKFTETSNDRENYEPDNNHNDSYQNFYRLIKRGELEFIKVVVPQETIRQLRSGTQCELKFTEDRKGNFWIINWQGVCFLIPKEKSIIHPYQYGNFQRVFNCQNYHEDYINFEVIEPAIVISCNRETWQLERKGTIKFNSDNQNKINNTQIKKNHNSEIDLKTKISRFRQDYAKDIKLISDLIVAKVAINVDTLEQIKFHKSDKIILENTPHGKYWIIDYLGVYFLIPSKIEQITKAQETALTVAQVLFYTSEYYPGYSSYYLIRPALVTKISTNQWELKEKGKFNFS